MFFQKYGMSPSAAVRAYVAFGENTVAVVQKNPYILAEKIDGITFKTADEIASEMGFLKNSYERI